MTNKKRRVLERPSGHGEVFDQLGQPIAQVAYDLVAQQELLVTRSSAASSTIPGLKDISGQLVVLSGRKDLMTPDPGPFTLHLEDGRQWQFITARGDPLSGTYRVCNASADGLTSP